jgi:uncharacterized protein GlcG (DUF336 family)
MSKLTLSAATTILEGAARKAAELQAKPLTISVVDAGGHIKALWRQDGASALRPKVATAKALTAINLGVPSRKVGEMAAERPTFVSAVSTLADGNIIPAAGGILILDGTEVIGAVGITGDTSDRDEQCAVAGVEAAGFKAGV